MDAGARVLRHDRLVAAVQAHRPPRDRLLERVAHAAVRHPQAAPGTRSCASCSACRPRRCPSRCRAPTSYGETSEFGGSVPVAGIAGRPAGGPLRPGLPRAGPRQEHLRHRARSCSRTPAARRRGARGAAHDGRVGRGRPHRLRARGRDLRDRRRRAVAARRPGDDQGGRRDRGAGALARLQRRRLLRARAHRPRLAALGPVRARHDRRAHPRHRAAPTWRAPRSRRWPTRRWTRCGRWRPPRA